MPPKTFVRRAIAIGALLAAAAVQAQSNQTPDNQTTVTVRANVAAKCRVANGPSVLFLQIDPAGAGPIVSNTADVGFHCTKGTPFEVFVNGQRASATVNGLTLKPQAVQGNAQAGAITYSLSTRTPGAVGLGFGGANQLSVGLSASVAQGEYATAAAGDYEDTVTVEIRP